MWRPIAFTGVLGLFALQVGCVAYATTEPLPPPEPAAAVVVDYSPLYYQGNVVLYDAGARPYYIVSGRHYYVPRTYANYNVLVRHYHRSPAAYHRWYGTHYPSHRMHGPRHPVHRAPPPPRRHHHHH